jgi:hypothetical protein
LERAEVTVEPAPPSTFVTVAAEADMFEREVEAGMVSRCSALFTLRDILLLLLLVDMLE